MTPDDDDPLVRQARLRRDRHDRWLREGDMSVGRRLAQIGVLGWMIVVPMLAGIFTGRWLDARFGDGIFWTAPCLMLGLGLGGWTAWNWMNAE
ncbi:AtpZ/AtpI family protein [Loktanella salsilacus]|jgi:ATP synthase protein I|uniref:ATP synthase protein I n=1 Tax=Loktanella salsilacus TaxID=195913 RepID=A0A1I4J0R4_9RHOB|nr:AtpZ/AtpI family protein [Loktanella salsilacus]MBU0779376.1 AtpZ/AtpI family protein [Alphaproteobacteria bacterium]MBU0861427.1 AtpZ/AtpI family protein [Alphaproteobacteria bacterium]MBU1835867.1 AtpZ/AtpI family protein [Alphaproteobacteria bacterium]SFL59803.1 ATP synthase protein I [Loktanella salsilacus]|tara:strand:+ start:7801 stop:8079 length:279 start_codon:yes stop_codon:yes gene_type:complete